MTDFEGDPDTQDLLCTPNWEKTRELQKQERYVKFKEWLDQNGVFNPSVEYPVAYGKQG